MAARRYRKVSVSIWGDRKFIALKDDAKLLWLLLLTHPAMTSLGAIRTTIAHLATDLRWTTRKARAAFAQIVDMDMARSDPGAGLIVLPNFLKHNTPENPNIVKSYGALIDGLPECDLLDEHLIECANFLKLLGEPFSKPFQKGMPNHEHEHQPEHDHHHLPEREPRKGGVGKLRF